MKYHSATIGELLSRLNRDIFIPGIQRPYVRLAEIGPRRYRLEPGTC